jgi:Beta-lactamase superfamily domain
MHETSFKYLNHSSILIKHANQFILTDPWFERPAFGSWLSVPPIAVHPVYLQTLARCAQNFMIVISHGHDDHLDDEWLANFPKDVSVLVPKFPSPGTRKRIQALGFKQVVEIPDYEIQVGNIGFHAFFNPGISRFDAIVSIDTGDSLIIHANDNWNPLSKKIKRRFVHLQISMAPKEHATSLNVISLIVFRMFTLNTICNHKN